MLDEVPLRLSVVLPLGVSDAVGVTVEVSVADCEADDVLVSVAVIVLDDETVGVKVTVVVDVGEADSVAVCVSEGLGHVLDPVSVCCGQERHAVDNEAPEFGLYVPAPHAVSDDDVGQ